MILSFSGKEAVGNNYHQLWAFMSNLKFPLLQRIAKEDRVVDDSIVMFESEGWIMTFSSRQQD